MPLAQASAHLGRSIEEELKRGDRISIISLVDSLIAHAHASRASDIHIDPTQEDVRVRLRVDGVLQDAFIVPASVHSEVVSRIKVLSSLRTDEHAASQDGRLRYTLPVTGEPLDVRVSIVPAYHGETIVMRLLASHSGAFTLEDFGFNAADRAKIERAIRRPSGMILSTGPTGSGKTTTLYTLLRQLNTSEVSIVTIEDPIEYAMEGIKQIQVNPKTGLTFANGLRSILLQDPNIIMVGEIRDPETAGIAVNTALTGHLLLSTVHTNDAATTLPRLLDMGIDAYLVSSTIALAIGQRLVRRICSNCKEDYEADAELAAMLARLPLRDKIRKGERLWRGKGCESCSGSGYAGRVCINEVFEADDAIRAAIMRTAAASELKLLALQAGMTSMLEDGIGKARAGRTTVEEVLRVMYE
ncbi:MAG TPA: GspE/PulE family protein [Candidatus Paceibacterota bacterium]|nr:GspE/PulE family protein [Candidatus Paceibacterota bacterium]